MYIHISASAPMYIHRSASELAVDGIVLAAADIRKNRNICKHEHMHTHMHTYIYTYIHTYIHTYLHANIRTYKRAGASTPATDGSVLAAAALSCFPPEYTGCVYVCMCA